jgi:hypothetical protein
VKQSEWAMDVEWMFNAQARRGSIISVNIPLTPRTCGRDTVLSLVSSLRKSTRPSESMASTLSYVPFGAQCA